MSETLKSKVVQIRKPRQCFSCLRIFPTKSKMNNWVGIYEGDFQSNYSCLACVEVMNMSSEVEFCEGYVLELLNKGETPEQLIERLKTKLTANEK